MATGAYIALGAIALFTIVTWVFVFRYRLRAWQSTPEGVTIMFMKVCLASVTTIMFVFRFWLSGPEWDEVRWTIYTIGFLVMTWLMIRFNKHLLKRPKRNKNERSDSTSSETKGGAVL